jgi:hypothetical protein
MRRTFEENKEQVEALKMMHGGTLDLIHKHGAEFRAIINDFAAKLGRIPTGNELLWIASEHAGRDLTEPEE